MLDRSLYEPENVTGGVNVNSPKLSLYVRFPFPNGVEETTTERSVYSIPVCGMGPGTQLVPDQNNVSWFCGVDVVTSTSERSPILKELILVIYPAAL